MTDFPVLLAALAESSVEFILVGGAAATAHGSARLTVDLDVVYRRTPENLARLVTSLGPLRPYLRGAPAGLPFCWDVDTLRRGLNFTLITIAGAIDVLGEISGGGTYDELSAATEEIELFGLRCRSVTLEKLIHLKRAAGRPKDLEAIAELEAIVEERAR